MSRPNDYEDLEGYQYTVVVGNIGTVYEGPDIVQAQDYYRNYVELSRAARGRAADEPVALLEQWEGKHGENGPTEILQEYRP